MAHVPTGLAEFDREPVQKFLVRRPRAHDAEVIRRLHDTGAENLLPDAVHGDPREQGVLGFEQPPGEFEPVLRLVRAGKEIRCRGLHQLLASRVNAAVQHPCVRRGFPLAGDQGGSAVLAELGDFLVRVADLFAQFRGLGIDASKEIAIQSQKALVGGPCFRIG